VSPAQPDDRRRPARVASRIREELATALVHDLSDPRLTRAIVSAVEVTDDLSLARVCIAAMNDDAGASVAREACRVLRRLEGGLRKRLASRLGMRRVPTLRFVIDPGRLEAERLDRLLHEVSGELKPDVPPDESK